MVPVIYAPEAERDLDAITAYIAKDNPKAAEQFGYRLIARADWCAELHRLRGVFLASIGGVGFPYAHKSRAFELKHAMLFEKRSPSVAWMVNCLRSGNPSLTIRWSSARFLFKLVAVTAWSLTSLPLKNHAHIFRVFEAGKLRDAFER